MKNSLRLLVFAVALVVAPAAFANHSVFVEGYMDFDGDGLLGVDEDTDGDLVFGTLGGAVAGVGQNGSVTVVTSGQFNENLSIVNPGGNTVIQAAPGVFAVLEAFRPPGNDPDNTTRQNLPGISVEDTPSAPASGDFAPRVHEGEDDGQRVVVLRNLHIRNYTVGVVARGSARVTIDNCILDSNTSYGIEAVDSARVTISNTSIAATGRRTTPSPGLLPATPGVGIAAKNTATIDLFNTIVTGSTGAGIANLTDDGAPWRLRTNDVMARHNKPGLDFLNFTPARFDIPTTTPQP